MAKKSAINQLLESGKLDQSGLDAVRGVATLLGRTIYLTCMAAKIGAGDDEMAKVDESWRRLADNIIIFAMEEN